jgi:hypothetical protein
MKKTLFSDLASLCEALEGTKKRTEIARMLGEFLGRVLPDEVPMAVNLILAKARRASDITRKASGVAPGTLGLSGASVVEVLEEMFEKKDYPLEAPDFGEAVRVLFERGGHLPQGERLTLESVSRTFDEIAGQRAPVRGRKRGS